MRRLGFAVLFAFLFASTGCDKMPWSSDKKSDDSEKDGKKKKKKESKGDDDDDKSSKDDDDEGGGGIPDSCKKYKKKYGPCVIDKVPSGAAKKQTKEAWEKSMESWEANAKTKAGRKALDDSCKQLLEALPEDCDK